MALLENEFFIKNARLSFPHLFEKPTINGEVGSYGAVFLIDLEDSQHKDVASKIKAYGNKLIASKPDIPRIPPHLWCCRDGDNEVREEYHGSWIIKTSSRRKPRVVDRVNPRLVHQHKEQSAIYPGCYVNGKFRVWLQSNVHGRRINAELIAIQLYADGEPLGGVPAVSDEQAVEGFVGFDLFDNPEGEFDDLAFALEEVAKTSSKTSTAELWDAI